MTTSSLRGKSHAASLLDGSGQRQPKTEQERAAALNANRLPNLAANARMVAGDLPDPAAVGYLLLLFDQCRLYELTHEQLVVVFGRPLLSFLDLSLQAIEQLAQRSGLGSAAACANANPSPISPEAAQAAARRPCLTPYQLTRMRDIAGDYAAALPDSRALSALLLVYDLLEIFELSPGQCETVFGAETLRYLTGVVYGERAKDKQPAVQPAQEEKSEGTQEDLEAENRPADPRLRINGRPVPFFGTVGENGRVTYTPEARLWLRYIGRPGSAVSGPIAGDNGGAA